jgi:polyhydroxyalkanoate synthesis regulator phasin
MGLLNQMKMAQEMMKGMSPEQMQELMEQAKDQKNQMEGTISALIGAEIQKRGLVTRAEVEEMIKGGNDV